MFNVGDIGHQCKRGSASRNTLISRFQNTQANKTNEGGPHGRAVTCKSDVS